MKTSALAITLALVASNAATRELGIADLQHTPLCPGHAHLGDVGGDAAPDLWAHPGCEEVWAIGLFGQTFTPLALRVVSPLRGEHEIRSDRGGVLRVHDVPAGTLVHFPDGGAFRNVTELRWATPRGSGALGGLVLRADAAPIASPPTPPATRPEADRRAPATEPTGRKAARKGAEESTASARVADGTGAPPSDRTAPSVDASLERLPDRDVGIARYRVRCRAVDSEDPAPGLEASVIVERQPCEEAGCRTTQAVVCGEEIRLAVMPGERIRVALEVTATDRTGNRDTVSVEPRVSE